MGMGLGPQTRAPWHHRGMVTRSICATRMLGGSFTLAVLDLVPGGFTPRFALIAVIAGLAALSLARFAPRPGRHRVGFLTLRTSLASPPPVRA